MSGRMWLFRGLMSWWACLRGGLWGGDGWVVGQSEGSLGKGVRVYVRVMERCKLTLELHTINTKIYEVRPCLCAATC